MTRRGRNPADGLHALARVHRQEDAEDSRPAEMKEGEVDLGKALGNLAQLVAEQRVPRNVEAHRGRVGVRRPPVEDAPHHRRQHQRQGTGGMSRRHARDGQPRVPLRHLHPLPGFQPARAVESLALQGPSACGGRHDRQPVIELLLHEVVEVIAVEVRQQHEIHRRQLFDAEGRLRQAGRGEAVSEVDVVALMEEVRVGEDGEPAIPDEHGGRAHELHRPAAEPGRAVVSLRLSLASPLSSGSTSDKGSSWFVATSPSF